LDALDEAMETFFNLHQIRWQSQKRDGVFVVQRFRDFHLDVAKSFAERGWLNLCFLTLNDEPVSAIYAFKYRNKMFNYLTGFNPKYSEYHVGHILFLYSIKNSIENGLREFDFMRGDETYKQQWNTLIRNNLEVRAIKKRIVPIVYDFITKKDVFTPLATTLGKRISLAQLHN
jgi:CelD/BcsL family acetyltransferase involved in cellulose biosynthesis